MEWTNSPPRPLTGLFRDHHAQCLHQSRKVFQALSEVTRRRWKLK